MKNLRTLLLISCSVYWGAYPTPKAKAGEWDQKTVLTFSQPVEIPGIILPAGTYMFSFLGSTADRNIIEVLSQDENKVHATVEAIPDYRANATGETSIVFEERKAGAPPAIKEWFFPDRRYGHEFVYPETGTLELGKFDEPESANNLVESAGLQSIETPSTKNAPDVTMGHSGQMMRPEETDYLRLLHQKQTGAFELTKSDESANKPIESVVLSYLQVLHQKQIEQIPAQTAMVNELPRTSSPLPLVGLSGILLFSTSVGLRLYFKGVN
jgi:hypothetical protein